jgi:DtxR family transcriptional regulator, Mn-dependent transcriptional regulator
MHLLEKPLTSVMEDYLEAIYELEDEKRFVRVKDIAKRMDVKMPTVTSMLKTLRDRGMVNYEKYEYVELTKGGAGVGKEIHRRHGILRDFLSQVLKIDMATADVDACKMEHALSPDTLDSLTDFMAFIKDCPRAGDNWLQNFEEYRKKGLRPDVCKERRADFSKKLNKKAAVSKKNAGRSTKKK